MLEEGWKERKEEEEKGRVNKDFPLVGWRESERGKENVGTGFLLGQSFFSPSKLYGNEIEEIVVSETHIKISFLSFLTCKPNTIKEKYSLSFSLKIIGFFFLPSFEYSIPNNKVRLFSP